MRRKDPRPAMSGMSYDDYRHETHLASVIAARRPFGAGGEARAPPSRVTPSPARAAGQSPAAPVTDVFLSLSLSSQPVEMFCSRVKLSTATNGLVILLRTFLLLRTSVSPPPNECFSSSERVFLLLRTPPFRTFLLLRTPPFRTFLRTPLRTPLLYVRLLRLLPSFLRLLPSFLRLLPDHDDDPRRFHLVRRDRRRGGGLSDGQALLRQRMRRTSASPVRCYAMSAIGYSTLHRLHPGGRGQPMSSLSLVLRGR